MSWLCCISITVTILAGGFVAGTHAGFTYNTFPLMDGSLLPSDYASLQPLWRNLTENLATVQFDHRLLATFTVIAVICTLVIGFSSRPPAASRRTLVALGSLAACQYVLGVATLLLVVPIALAAMHQAVATLLLTASVVLLHTIRPARIARRA
jgi:cytochrome c oxidase assembly protein subunit 15